MKKVLLILVALIMAPGLFAQPVNRERVIMEIGTGTWCTYCPGAAMGADDLVANGHDVAVIEYHDGDAFSNAASDHRISYYGISGFPTAFFDGTLSYVGGSATQSMYNNYLPIYQQAIAVQCDYEAEIYGENTGTNYQVQVVIDLVNGTPPPNLKAHLVLTESEIAYSWQGQSELNYVCRAMYPDEYGTTVDFAAGDQVLLTYNFTIDPTWNTQHIELVAFVQDDMTKEILQGTMVPIENLQPISAIAAFSCSNQQPCESSTVDFNDNSLGAVISWDWYFEGGTPSTSTVQNPSITYNTGGEYDVQLIVSDGVVTDTMLMENFVDVVAIPAQASSPSGPADICADGEIYTYTTGSVPEATDYTWEIDPASAGTITGNGVSADLEVNAGYLGDIDIKVRAENQCGNAPWSQALTTTVHENPAIFWISDGGGFCEGGDGVEVYLEGSETGIDYELLLDGSPTGNIVAGTGSSVSFGFQTDGGLYTAVGTNTFCETTMYGNAYVYEMSIPGQASAPSGENAACSGNENIYTTDGATDAESYTWTLDPPDAGTLTPNDLEATILWSETFTGQATLTVQGINSCGDGAVSDPIDISVNANPEPEISGDELVCQNTGGYVYESADHSQADYSWTVTGGNITDGQGTSQITVTWGNMGTGYVNLTETLENCEGVAGEFTVVIDECVGIAESIMDAISIYPNPADDMLNLEIFSLEQSNIEISIYNQVGQKIMGSGESLNTGNNKIVIRTSELQSGFYTMQITAEDGSTANKKFFIVE